jgi:hypothetical protein
MSQHMQHIVFIIALALLFGGIALWVVLDLMGLAGRIPKPSLESQRIEDERNRKR